MIRSVTRKSVQLIPADQARLWPRKEPTALPMPIKYYVYVMSV